MVEGCGMHTEGPVMGFFGHSKERGISWLAEQLLAFEEGLSCVESIH
jgi:hypothetical protein